MYAIRTFTILSQQSKGDTGTFELHNTYKLLKTASDKPCHIARYRESYARNLLLLTRRSWIFMKSRCRRCSRHVSSKWDWHPYLLSSCISTSPPWLKFAYSLLCGIQTKMFYSSWNNGHQWFMEFDLIHAACWTPRCATEETSQYFMGPSS